MDKNTPGTNNKYSKVARYRVNIIKLIAYIYQERVILKLN